MKEAIHYSYAIEAALLGQCLIEKEAFGRSLGLVEEKHFYHVDHQLVYREMKDMQENSVPIDYLILWQRLTSKNVQFTFFLNHPNPTGALSAFICSLTNNVVNTAHLEVYCHSLREMWQKRELLRLTHSGINETDVRSAGASLTQSINEILGGEVKKDWQSMDEIMFDLMVEQQRMKEGQKSFTTTGFKAIDKMNGGFTGGQLVIVGARPSVGKSAIMGKMAIEMAKTKKPVGIVSLEMNNTDIAARLASLETDMEFWRIHRNLFIDESQHERFYNLISKQTIHLPIYVSDKTKVDVMEIKSKAIKLKRAHGLDVLMVDYLQLVDSPAQKNYNREQEVAKISRGLKLLAMELDITVVVLCQLNRAVTQRKRGSHYPQLSDLRESGAIEQDADCVLMLHRDWMSGYEQDENGYSTEHQADLLGVKWRNGATFHLQLDFDPQKMKFSEKGGQLTPVHFQENQTDEDLF